MPQCSGMSGSVRQARRIPSACWAFEVKSHVGDSAGEIAVAVVIATAVLGIVAPLSGFARLPSAAPERRCVVARAPSASLA